MTYHFTKEERQDINCDLKKAAELLLDMATKAQLGDKKITFTIGHQHDIDYDAYGFSLYPELSISQKEIRLYLTSNDNSKSYDVSLYRDGQICYSEDDENFILDCLFLRELPKIKEDFANSIKEYTNKKWSFWKRFMDSHKKNQVLFDEVVIDFPESIDKHTITLEEKDGKKIGTINFGERSIRIITSGNIVLETQSEAKKVKKK